MFERYLFRNIGACGLAALCCSERAGFRGGADAARHAGGGRSAERSAAAATGTGATAAGVRGDS